MKDIKTIQLSEAAPRQTSAGASGMAWQAGDLATIFQTDDGDYGYCYHGVASDGNAYEGDDVTGFTSVEEAEAEARENYR